MDSEDHLLRIVQVVPILKQKMQNPADFQPGPISASPSF